MHIHICIYIYIYIYIYMYVCMYVCEYIHTSTGIPPGVCLWEPLFLAKPALINCFLFRLKSNKFN